MKNIREGWSRIESNGKVDKAEENKLWRQSKRKKLNKRNQKLESRQKMMMKKWAT